MVRPPPPPSFGKIPPVPTADQLLDVAMRRASDAASRARSTKFSRDRMARSRQIEKVRITVLKDVLASKLDAVFASFPDLRRMSSFYQELARTLIDMEQFKRSLAAIRWAITTIYHFWAMYNTKITKTQEITSINPYRREYYGRIASVVKQVKANLKFLEDCRKTMKGFPIIDGQAPTVVLAGFPNVGKTTLLFKLTGSKPEIADYAFTTRSINHSTYKEEERVIQVLDTPGTLNRFEKMNVIEKQAYLAMKHLAHVIVYIFDPLESYPLDQQERLYHQLKKIGKPMLVYVSKTDIGDAQVVEGLAKRFAGITSPATLKAELHKIMGEVQLSNDQRYTITPL